MGDGALWHGSYTSSNFMHLRISDGRALITFPIITTSILLNLNNKNVKRENRNPTLYEAHAN